jgi:predicted nucleic acid-binding protein
MTVKVVDASAIGALLFGEPEGPNVARRLENSRLIAPHLLPFEVVSVCHKKLQRHAEQRHLLLAALDMFMGMAIERIEISLSGVLSLAEPTQLTIYDATYLWLARQAEAELITLDQKLAAATLAL